MLSTFDELWLLVEAAGEDPRRLANLRRRVRRNRRLTDAGRLELLHLARYEPGCIPPTVELEPYTRG